MKKCREETQLGVAKAARFPPCTLPFLAQAPTLRLSHDHTSMAAALALIGCGQRSQDHPDGERFLILIVFHANVGTLRVLP